MIRSSQSEQKFGMAAFLFAKKPTTKPLSTATKQFFLIPFFIKFSKNFLKGRNPIFLNGISHIKKNRFFTIQYNLYPYTDILFRVP